MLGELWWLDELLAAAHSDLAVGLPAATPVPAAPNATTAAEPSGPASHPGSLDEELLRQQNSLL